MATIDEILMNGLPPAAAARRSIHAAKGTAAPSVPSLSASVTPAAPAPPAPAASAPDAQSKEAAASATGTTPPPATSGNLGLTLDTQAAKPIMPRKIQLSYRQMMDFMSPYKPESAEDKAKREKKEKRDKIFAAINDGISALSNLFFATKGAPSAFDPSGSMSAKTRERLDRLRAEREANGKAYFDQYLRAMQLDEAREREELTWRRQLERDRKADAHQARQEAIAAAKDKRAEKKAERDELMFQAKYALQMEKLTYQGYMNAIAEIKAGHMEELTQAQIDRLNRMGTGGSNSGGGGGSRQGKYEFLGERYQTQSNYNEAVMLKAQDMDIDIFDKYGNNRKVADIAAEVRRKVGGQQPAPATNGSAKSNNDSSKPSYTNTKKLGL